MSALVDLLVTEIVKGEDAVTYATEIKDERRQAFAQARQALDAANAALSEADARLTYTKRALEFIQERDAIARDVVEALIALERAR
jgi:hypothetical protein